MNGPGGQANAPDTVILNVLPVALNDGGGVHRLTFADSLTPDSRKKPPDVQNLQLYVAVAKELVTDPAKGVFRGLYGKNPIEVEHQPSDNGKMATYFGRWCTRTGLTGP